MEGGCRLQPHKIEFYNCKVGTECIIRPNTGSFLLCRDLKTLTSSFPTSEREGTLDKALPDSISFDGELNSVLIHNFFLGSKWEDSLPTTKSVAQLRYPIIYEQKKSCFT